MSAATPGHAELMDAVYRWQRGFYDVTRKPYLLGRDRLIEGLALPDGGSVLEIGCGTARNLVQAARRWPRASFHGFDISSVMLETARDKVASAGLTDRIRLARADAASFDAEALFGRRGFDRVFVSYALSMIPSWREAIEAGLDAVEPGGALAIVDFGDQAGLPPLFKRGLRAWLRAFHVSPRDDIEAALAVAAVRRGAVFDLAKPYLSYAMLARVTVPARAR